MLQQFINCYPDITDYANLSIDFLWKIAAPMLAVIIGTMSIPKVVRAVFGGID